MGNGKQLKQFNNKKPGQKIVVRKLNVIKLPHFANVSTIFFYYFFEMLKLEITNK